MKTKTTTYALTALLLVTSLYACGADGTAQSGGETTAAVDIPTEAVTTEPVLRENVPEEDMGGAVFSIMIDEGTSGMDDFIAEEETGDLLNDAVYRRNSVIEERFNITLDAYINGYAGTFVKNLNTFISAGDSTVDVAMGMNNISTGITALVYDGYFVDWNELEYVDVTQPWWDENIIRDLSFGGKIYTMTGDFNPSTLGNTRILLFNKNMLSSLDMEYPYEKVLDGTWTYDVFAEMIKAGLSDVNGDGVYDADNDRWGYVGWQYDIGESVYIGLGGTYATKDANNMPVLNLNTDRSIDILDKMLALFADGAGAWQNAVEWGKDMTAFAEGRAMFANSRLYLLNNFRDMTDDFGIIPHPKYDVSQENYSQSVDAVCTLAYIPMTNEDLRATSIILEAMAAESWRSVMPTYYEVVLQTKYTRDDDSEAMIDIIKENRYYTLQLDTFNFSTMTEMIKKGENNFASTYAKKEKKVNQELEEIIAAYSD